MNLDASAIVLRPRPLAEILDLACRLSVVARVRPLRAPPALLLLPMLRRLPRAALRGGLAWPAVWARRRRAGGVVAGRLHRRRGPAALLGGARRGPGAPPLRAPPRLVPARCSSLSRLLLVAAALPLLLGLPFAWPRLVFVHEASLLEGAGAGRGHPAQQPLRRRPRRAAVFGVADRAARSRRPASCSPPSCSARASSTRCSSSASPSARSSTTAARPRARGLLALGSPTSRPRASSTTSTRARASDGWDIQLRFMAIAAREGPRGGRVTAAGASSSRRASRSRGAPLARDARAEDVRTARACAASSRTSATASATRTTTRSRPRSTRGARWSADQRRVPARSPRRASCPPSSSRDCVVPAAAAAAVATRPAATRQRQAEPIAAAGGRAPPPRAREARAIAGHERLRAVLFYRRCSWSSSVGWSARS